MIHAEGRRFPVSVRIPAPGRTAAELAGAWSAATVPDAVRDDAEGHVLVFLPGVGEIMRAQKRRWRAPSGRGTRW